MAIPQFSIVAPAETIRDLLCGPQDHNEHCKGWRWHLYVRDNDKRMENVMAELRAFHIARRARIEALRNEAALLEAAE